MSKLYGFEVFENPNESEADGYKCQWMSLSVHIYLFDYNSSQLWTAMDRYLHVYDS